MIEEKNKIKIFDIMEKMKCLKDFSCRASGFENLCEARNFGLDDYLECLEANPLDCGFKLPFGKGNLCKCPARVAIAKRLNK